MCVFERRQNEQRTEQTYSALSAILLCVRTRRSGSLNTNCFAFLLLSLKIPYLNGPVAQSLVLVFGTKDCRLESCQVMYVRFPFSSILCLSFRFSLPTPLLSLTSPLCSLVFSSSLCCAHTHIYIYMFLIGHGIICLYKV